MAYLILVTFCHKDDYFCFISEETEVKGITWFTVAHDYVEVETAFELRKLNFRSPGPSGEKC